jgi:hypothetical protein
VFVLAALSSIIYAAAGAHQWWTMPQEWRVDFTPVKRAAAENRKSGEGTVREIAELLASPPASPKPGAIAVSNQPQGLISTSGSR